MAFNPDFTPDDVVITADEAAELADVVARGDVREIAAWLSEHPGQPAVTAAVPFVESKFKRFAKGTKVGPGGEGGGRFAPKSESEKIPPEQQAAEDELTRQIFTKDEAAQEILGDAVDTEDLHSNPGPDGGRAVYDAERVLEVHQPIMEHFLSGANGVTYEEPYTLFMAGGSGVGKSTILAELAKRGELPPNSVYINPDDIKEMLPEYEELVNRGSKYAAFAAHEESSTISKKILDQARLRGYNVILDGTGDSIEPGKFMEKIQDDLDSGRYSKVILVDAPTDEALARATTRAEEKGRWIAPRLLRDVHQHVASQHFGSGGTPGWADQAEDWEMWATDGTGAPHPWRVARKIGGVTRIYDSPRYNFFREKATGGGSGRTFEPPPEIVWDSDNEPPPFKPFDFQTGKPLPTDTIEQVVVKRRG